MLEVTYKGKQVEYAGEVINSDCKHNILILIDGNYREVEIKDVSMDLSDDQRDITDKRRFCYVCGKIIGNDWILLGSANNGHNIKISGDGKIYRHENCCAGSRKWVNSSVGRNSPMHSLFKIEGTKTYRMRPNASKPENPCRCGCGAIGTGNFRPGHDAKLKSKMIANIKAGKDWSDGLADISIGYVKINWVNLPNELLTKYK